MKFQNLAKSKKKTKQSLPFTAQNYDVSLTLEPIDDDHIKGNLLGMFDAKGIRVKES